MADLNGADYRARVEITNKAGETVAAIGETCERIDPASLGWLLDQHCIEPASAVLVVPPVETRAEGDD